MMRKARVVPVLLLPLLAAFIPVQRPLTVWLAGDSTMAEKLPEKRPETGWGELLQRYFDPGRVRVANRAVNGRSTRTFLTERRWQAIVDSLEPGDYVLIEFGHNDESVAKVDRYTPPADFRANLTRMVAEVRARGATPVLLTPVMRRRFDAAGRVRDTHGEYPDLVRAVAAGQRVALLDLHRATTRLLRREGAEGSRRLFLHLAPGENGNYPQGLDDDTHFSPLGADRVARLAVDALRHSRLGLRRELRERPDSAGEMRPGS